MRPPAGPGPAALLGPAAALIAAASGGSAASRLTLTFPDTFAPRLPHCSSFVATRCSQLSSNAIEQSSCSPRAPGHCRPSPYGPDGGLSPHARAKLPTHVEGMIRNFPKGMHPMTQLSSAILALQTDSVFAREYAKGTNKALYWDHSYEDMMNLIARLPEVAAIIYRCTYYDGVVKPYDNTLDYSANFAQMLGYDDPSFHELMRLYIVIHSDHEGGNASAHTCHLVGSTLSDPYLSLCASMKIWLNASVSSVSMVLR